jgi:hypothetical protein
MLQGARQAFAFSSIEAATLENFLNWQPNIAPSVNRDSRNEPHELTVVSDPIRRDSCFASWHRHPLGETGFFCLHQHFYLGDICSQPLRLPLRLRVAARVTV